MYQIFSSLSRKSVAIILFPLKLPLLIWNSEPKIFMGRKGPLDNSEGSLMKKSGDLVRRKLAEPNAFSVRKKKSLIGFMFMYFFPGGPFDALSR